MWDWIVFWITAPIFVLGILSILRIRADLASSVELS
jgi:hypothetical protein